MAPKRQIAGDNGGKREAEQHERLLLAGLCLVNIVDGMARIGCPHAGQARDPRIGKNCFLGYCRQGHGMRPGMAAADGKGHRPEQGERQREIGKPATQLACSVVDSDFPLLPRPAFIPTSRRCRLRRRPRARLPLLDTNHARQLGGGEPTMWPVDWIPVSEKSSVNAVSGVQRGPLRKSVAAPLRRCLTGC